MNKEQNTKIECRAGCGACCIIPSISSAIPGMPEGKPAFVPCIQLTADYGCKIFNSPERPKVCGSLKPSLEMCGCCREEAIRHLSELERLTAPQG